MNSQEDLANFDKAMRKEGFEVVDPKGQETTKDARGASELTRWLAEMDDETCNIYLNLLSLTKQRIQKDKERGRTDRFYRYVHTSHIADEIGCKNSWLRYRLNKMEEKGYVRSKRSSNNNVWSPEVIPGYEDHKYDDYVRHAS